MLQRVGVQSTHPYPFYGRRVGYQIRSVDPWGHLFQCDIWVYSLPTKPLLCFHAASSYNRLGTGLPIEDSTAACHNHRTYIAIRDAFMQSSLCMCKLCLCLWPVFFFILS